ncbi:MAG: hypothetical protein ACHQF3_03785 [Alphaproteobacteria bacterium]
MPSEEGRIRTVAQQAVSAMVGAHIKVTVGANRAPAARAPRDERPAAHRAAGATVAVEMTGPDGAPHRGDKLVTARAEASAWGIDEIVSAARRAADRILTDNPSWRRPST